MKTQSSQPKEDIRIIYLEEDNEITLHCPQCGQSKSVDVSKWLDKPGPLRLRYRFKCSRCDCGHKDCRKCPPEKCTNNKTSFFNLERRRHFRKTVDLEGIIEVGKRIVVPARIVDLSRSGLKLQPLSASAAREGLPSAIIVSFTLDDNRKTKVKKKCRIKGRTADGLECSFVDSESFDANDKAIGFYLMQRS